MPVPPYIPIQEVWELRRTAARYPSKWRAAGREITDENKRIIGRMSDPDMTKLVVRCHNLILTILNKLFVALAKIGDRRLLDKEEGKDEI